MRGAQDHARRTTGLQRLLPTRCAQTPSITRFESGEAELRDRCRKIVAARFRELEKLGGDNGTYGVVADILAAGVTTAVAKKTCHRTQGADLKPLAEHVFRFIGPATAAATRIFFQHDDFLHRIPLHRRQYRIGQLDDAVVEHVHRLELQPHDPRETGAVFRDPLNLLRPIECGSDQDS